MIDVSCTHTADQIFAPMRQYFRQNALYFKAMDGLGLCLFNALETTQGKQEPFVQVVNSAVSALSAGQRMGSRQLGALREAVIEVVQNGCPGGDEARALAAALKRKSDDEYAVAVYQKLWVLLCSGALKTASKHLQTSQINIIDLSDADNITQNALVEIILRTLWRKIRFAGLSEKHRKLTIVLDEFQNLSIKRESILCNMLREGRKFGINFLLAAQSLMNFPREVHPLIAQTATRLYFRPASNEMKRVAREIDPEKTVTWNKILQSLKVGECIAVGELQIGEVNIGRPLRLDGI